MSFNKHGEPQPDEIQVLVYVLETTSLEDYHFKNLLYWNLTTDRMLHAQILQIQREMFEISYHQNEE